MVRAGHLVRVRVLPLHRLALAGEDQIGGDELTDVLFQILRGLVDRSGLECVWAGCCRGGLWFSGIRGFHLVELSEVWLEESERIPSSTLEELLI